MNDRIKHTMTRVTGVALLSLSMGLWACAEEGPFEKAGENLDETLEEAGEEVEDAVEGSR